MIFDNAIRDAYPDICAWMCVNLPKVRHNPKIFKAFQEYAKFDEKTAERAIIHGNPPIISYRRMGSENGMYLDKYPDNVFISIEICRRFKEGMKDTRMTILVESTILHEIVHWGNALGKFVPNQEQGKAFEKAAYGYDVKSFWP